MVVCKKRHNGNRFENRSLFLALGKARKGDGGREWVRECLLKMCHTDSLCDIFIDGRKARIKKILVKEHQMESLSLYKLCDGCIQRTHIHSIYLNFSTCICNIIFLKKFRICLSRQTKCLAWANVTYLLSQMAYIVCYAKILIR